MKTVLVIDDDELTCSVLKKLIERHNAEVVITRSGQDADAILRDQRKYALILLDLILPSSSGWDLLDQINNNPVLNNTSVVILTAADISAEERARLLTRVSAIVDKGTFDTDNFEKMLEQLL